MSPLLEALSIVFSPSVGGLLFIGVLAGIIIGAAPGLTSTIAIGLLIPFTYTLSKYAAFSLLIGIFCGSMYGGAIPAVLMNLPGTPSAATTALDGYPMARSGRAAQALSISNIASVIGGLISCVFLVFLSLQLASLAIAFAGPEYFALCLFSLAVVFSIAGPSILKGIAATGAGLLVSTIGLDPVNPYPRFTFGIPELAIGVPEVAATIGLFCVSEAFRLITDPNRGTALSGQVRTTLVDAFREARKFARTIWTSSLIGTAIGILPGTGATMASVLAYGWAKRRSKEPESFGKGNPEGVAASEAANNAVTGAALIPMITLGIPGDTNTLMLLGAMLIHGLVPGPALFRDETVLVYVIFLVTIISNLWILVLGLRGAPLIARVTQLDQRYILPAILVMSIAGPAISEGHIYYFWITIIFGALGFLMERHGYSVLAFAMALILGPSIERNLRAALMLPQSIPEIFLTRPIVVVFFLLTILVIVLGVTRELKQRNAIRPSPLSG